MKTEFKTDLENVKTDLQNRPKGNVPFGSASGPVQDSPLKKLALGLTQKLTTSIVNNALSTGNESQKQQQPAVDLEPIIKTITELSEQLVQLEESMTSEVIKLKDSVEQHQAVIDEFQRVSIKSKEPIPYALVEKLDGINNQVE